MSLYESTYDTQEKGIFGLTCEAKIHGKKNRDSSYLCASWLAWQCGIWLLAQGTRIISWLLTVGHSIKQIKVAHNLLQLYYITSINIANYNSNL